VLVQTWAFIAVEGGGGVGTCRRLKVVVQVWALIAI